VADTRPSLPHPAPPQEHARPDATAQQAPPSAPLVGLSAALLLVASPGLLHGGPGGHALCRAALYEAAVRQLPVHVLAPAGLTLEALLAGPLASSPSSPGGGAEPGGPLGGSRGGLAAASGAASGGSPAKGATAAAAAGGGAPGGVPGGRPLPEAVGF
jgi:hypothetical protein